VEPGISISEEGPAARPVNRGSPRSVPIACSRAASRSRSAAKAGSEVVGRGLAPQVAAAVQDGSAVTGGHHHKRVLQEAVLLEASRQTPAASAVGSPGPPAGAAISPQILLRRLGKSWSGFANWAMRVSWSSRHRRLKSILAGYKPTPLSTPASCRTGLAASPFPVPVMRGPEMPLMEDSRPAGGDAS
jgi:hypothetical protein